MKALSYLVFSFLICSVAAAQKIHYEFAAPNAAHHEAEISIAVDGLPAGPAIFRMSRSSPGRYATHEFGKNVYNVAAYDKAGNKLTIEKTDAEVYRVSNHKGNVVVKYTLYGNYADGTYASIDVDGYHLNMPASFMWVKGFDKAPITIHFNAPENWKIATQLKPGADAYSFSAPGLQYFMDAPTKIGNLHFREWKVTNHDHKSYTFRLALEAEAKEQTIDSFAQKIQRLVKEEQAVYGEVPAYDYGSYTFIASINPYVKGDGMEHRNSTMITSQRNFTGDDNQLSVFAHEFFHNWNVERIRPKSIEPFNFEKSNMSEALWVAEGFTQYYGLLLMKRAGFMPSEVFTQQVAGLINEKENTPGAKYYTPIENSQRAVFVDAGVSIDKTNYPNMFTSYYVYGGALALALDLQLRTGFHKTLDDFMQAMWKRFGKTEKAYTLPQMEETLATVTNDKTFAATFFKKYVYGHESLDYAPLLQAAGLHLKKAGTGNAWLGNIRFAKENYELTVMGNTIRDTPLYDAGVDVDDVLLQLDGKELRQQNDINDILAKHHAGDVISVQYRHRKQVKLANITLKESPFYSVVAAENDGDKINEAQLNFRNSWQGTQVK